MEIVIFFHGYYGNIMESLYLENFQHGNTDLWDIELFNYGKFGLRNFKLWKVKK